MIWDYDFLKKQVAEYLGRDDLEDRIPCFIQLAEKRMQVDLRLRCMERRATHLTTAGKEALGLPDKRISGDWDVFLDMREVVLEAAPPVNLEYVNPDFFTGISGGKGRPWAYSIIGREMLFSPTPDAEYNILLTYFAEIPPLGENQPTNDFLLTYPQLYLYSTLLESVPYSRGSAPAEIWVQAYESAKTSAQYGDTRARFSKQLRAKAPRRF